MCTSATLVRKTLSFPLDADYPDHSDDGGEDACGKEEEGDGHVEKSVKRGEGEVPNGGHNDEEGEGEGIHKENGVDEGSKGGRGREGEEGHSFDGEDEGSKRGRGREGDVGFEAEG